jgi:outer membrane receptor for ferrienterochelin and colicins
MRIKLFVAFILCFKFYYANAQDDTDKNAVELSSLSLDKLMNMQVVTASGYLQTTSEAPSTITVITAQEIVERGYEQLEDALRDVPGIDMIHINGYAPTLFYFRGMYGAENLRALLMIDGIVENNIIGSNDMAGPSYNLHNVERIEIIWGPASALYGADAFGGVINIITKKGGDINGIHAEKDYGSFNTTIDKINIGIKKQKFEFATAGTLYNTDGPVFANRDPNYNASYVDNAYSFNTTLSYTAKNTKTTFGFRTYNTPMGWGTFLNSPTALLNLPSQGYDNQGVAGILARDVRGEKAGLEDPYLRTVFLQNEYTPNPKLNLLARFVYRETGLNDNSYGYVTLDGHTLTRLIVTNYSNQVLGEVSANYSMSEKQRFSAGVEFYQDNLEKGTRNESPVFSRATTYDPTVYLLDGKDTVTNLASTFLPRQYDLRNNFGSYLQYILNTGLLVKTSFTLGVRYDYNSYFGSSTNPRIVIVNQPNDKLTFKLQFGTAFRAPTNTEIYQAPADFPLKTEKIKTYEVNGIYTLSKLFRLQVNGFRNELTDVIVISNLSSGFTEDKNPGKITVNGMESILDIFPTQQFSGFLNFTYQDANGENLVTNTSGAEPGVAKVKGNIGITMRTTDDVTMTLTGNWIGQRNTPRTDPYGPVAGYFLTNFVVNSGKVFNKGITASLIIHNAFNVSWLDPGFRTGDGYLYSTVLEQPGRTFLFKIGIDL